jgi:hypothetical protein
MPDPHYTVCIPGQGLSVQQLRIQSEAVAPYCVLITAPLGDFETQGSRSKVDLVVGENADGRSGSMTPHTWTKNAIVAWLPADSPAGSPDATFSVRVTTQSGSVYVASPVKVTSIGGAGGYPPTHDPTSGQILQMPVQADA